MIQGMEYAVRQITATLQTYLPAELATINTEHSDNITLVAVDNAAYFEFEANAAAVQFDSAIVVNGIGTSPLAIKSTTNSPGVYHVDQRIDVLFHKKDTDNEDPYLMKRRVLRMAIGIERVLAIKYPTLPIAGVESVFFCRREGEASYIVQEQVDQQNVRTAILPFLVTQYETL